jgi:hypothetical protein
MQIASQTFNTHTYFIKEFPHLTLNPQDLGLVFHNLPGGSWQLTVDS